MKIISEYEEKLYNSYKSIDDHQKGIKQLTIGELIKSSFFIGELGILNTNLQVKIDTFLESYKEEYKIISSVIKLNNELKQTTTTKRNKI